MNQLLSGKVTKNSDTNLDMNLQQFMAIQEKNFLTFHLQQEKDLDRVCEKLSISKSNLYKKIKDYEITYE